SRREESVLTGHDGPVYSVAFAPDGKSLASTGKDGIVRVWNLQTQTVRWTLPGHNNWIWTLAYSPDGQFLASAINDKTVKLWDIRNGTERQTLRGHTNKVRGVAFSNDGKILFSSDARGFRYWDVASGEQLGSWLPNDNLALPICKIDTLPDSRTMAIGGR